MENHLFPQHMSSEQFLAWLTTQERKFELVDGHPEMMAGASQDHNDIVSSGLAEITMQLKGKPCRPIGSDSAIQIPNGNTRFPDFGVDCGQRNGKSMVTTAPALVVEVLSPTTRFLDFNKKLDEYKSVASLKTILLVEQDSPRVHCYNRNHAGQWTNTLVEGLEAIAVMPELTLSLPLAILYERIQFSFKPSLVEPVSAQ